MKESRALGLIFLGVIGLWAACLGFGVWHFSSWVERGQFGDLFGAVNALFSGLAFAGLIYTIHLQRNELSLQREELKLQREEMAKSREELAKQVSAQRAQHKVAVGSLRVAALQAEIDAQKLESAQFVPGGQQNQIKAIRSVAAKIEGIANDLANEPYG